jgi:hypothetical protein
VKLQPAKIASYTSSPMITCRIHGTELVTSELHSVCCQYVKGTGVESSYHEPCGEDEYEK